MTVAEWEPALERFAQLTNVLIACDYDGTLAGLVDDPAAATASPASIDALRSLASMPGTSVAVVSGRSLDDLARLSGLRGDALLVGSHGSEFEGESSALDGSARTLLAHVVETLTAIVDEHPGTRLEVKPASATLHTREADPSVAPDLVREVLDEFGNVSGIHVKHGKDVVEFGVVDANKGVALQRLRVRLGVQAVMFIGDDVTDEDAFGVLERSDLGIKVGPEQTLAAFRVADVAEVAVILQRLCSLRERKTPPNRH
jgi:trehalose 6-phosphate phosphatase